jgi:predicted metal-dependent hydrolase
VRTRVRTLAADGGPIEYLITERSRLSRRLHLELDDDGRLLVVVPPGSDTVAVQRALRDNLEAVESYVARARARRLAPLVYEDGARHLYQGKTHRLRLLTSDEEDRCDDTIPVRLRAALHDDPAAVRRALRAWYLERSRVLFASRLEQVRQQAPWAHDLQLELALRRMRRTWGTCRVHAHGRAVIRLNTHLIKAPLPCLDFVIGHELCHLAEMNHGPDFYRLQDAICPDWRPLRDELRERGHHYTQE